MSSPNSLKDLLVTELKDLYDAEHQLVEALPKMARAASNPDLKRGFEEHLQQTKGHVRRLESVFELLSTPPRRKTCQAMKGLVEEGAEAISAKGPEAVCDAQLIGAAQRVEHYEIAAYGTARSFAETLEEEEAAHLLQETLAEEAETDKKLSELSVTVNAAAAGDEGVGVEAEGPDDEESA